MDKKILIGLAVVGGGLAFYFMSKKKDEEGAAPDFVPSDAVRDMKSSTQQIVSMGSDQKQTVSDITKQIEEKAIVSGEAGTEKQASGSGSVSADPKQQLRTMSARDLEDLAFKDSNFTAAIMDKRLFTGDIAEEIERRYGNELRAKMADADNQDLEAVGKAIRNGEGIRDARPGQLRFAWNYALAEATMRKSREKAIENGGVVRAGGGDAEATYRRKQEAERRARENARAGGGFRPPFGRGAGLPFQKPPMPKPTEDTPKPRSPKPPGGGRGRGRGR